MECNRVIFENDDMRVQIAEHHDGYFIRVVCGCHLMDRRYDPKRWRKHDYVRLESFMPIASMKAKIKRLTLTSEFRARRLADECSYEFARAIAIRSRVR